MCYIFYHVCNNEEQELNGLKWLNNCSLVHSTWLYNSYHPKCASNLSLNLNDLLQFEDNIRVWYRISLLRGLSINDRSHKFKTKL